MSALTARPLSLSPSLSHPPVTVISGFLGAGKTTLLQDILAKANAGKRWAAVVNDLAALNIDGHLIARAGASRVVELANGCVCCTVRDELAETIAELAAGGGGYEHIFVEASGVAEPRGVVGLFTRPNAFGRKLSDFARLHALVTVVDAAQWKEAWHALGKGKGAASLTQRSSREAKLPVELMLEQIECADVLVLNKTDLISEPDCAGLVIALRGLNTRAEIISTCEGRLPEGCLPGAVRFDETLSLSAARWLRVLGEPDPVSQQPALRRESLPWRTLVLRERRPFAEEKLRAFFKNRPIGLFRAKGFFWVAERSADMGYLSLAGNVLRWDFVGNWAADLLARGVINPSEIPADLRGLWEEPYGDRRQELVFIGLDFDPEALRTVLLRCLV